MSLSPDRWEPLARAALRRWCPDERWHFDEMVAAAVERFAELHARGELPAQPSKLALIARYAGLDEYRRIGVHKAGAARELPLSIDDMTLPSGEPWTAPDPSSFQHEDRVVDQLVAAVRVGRIMGSDLSPGERRILRLLMRDYTYQQIADEIGCSKTTISRAIDDLGTRWRIPSS